MFAYNPQTDTWTKKTDMTKARGAPVASAVDGIIYVIGGIKGGTWVGFNDVEAYDPKTDTWTRKADMPTPRGDMSGAAFNGLIYVFGGLSGSTSPLNTVECYDPKTDQWTKKKPLPTPMVASVAQVVDGLIYVFREDTTYAYDPETDQWTPKHPVPTTPSFMCGGCVAGTVEGVIYVLGGFQDSICASPTALAYDPTEDQFGSRRMMPEPRAGAAFATIGGKILVAGGVSGVPGSCPGAEVSDDLWVFDPQGGVMPRILTAARESTDTVRLVWRGEKGRLYGVRSRPNVAKGGWVSCRLSDGSTTIRATSDTVEATATVPAGDPQRYFIVYEAD
jgi:N-acetylneuraminic acid mutarotase